MAAVRFVQPASNSFRATTRFRLKPADHTPVEALRAAGAPELREIAVFRIARSSGFDPTKPFPARSRSRRAGSRVRRPRWSRCDYRVPDRYLIAPPVAPAAFTDPSYRRAASAPGQAPLWQDIWWAAALRNRACSGRCLPVLGGILIFQDTVTAHGHSISPAHGLSAADPRLPRPDRQRATVGRPCPDLYSRLAVGFPLGTVSA